VEQIAACLFDALLTSSLQRRASVGDHDTRRRAREASGKLVFHTVAIRPGKPVLSDRLAQPARLRPPGQSGRRDARIRALRPPRHPPALGRSAGPPAAGRARACTAVDRVKGLRFFARASVTTEGLC